MSSIVINGDTSGSVTLSAPAVSGSSVLTLPAVTDTLAGIAATQTLTNKTLTSPVLTTPALGTPSALVLTNATALPRAALPTGSVLQVVSFGTVNSVSNNTNVAVDTGVFATITPISATSKIFVLVTLMGVYKSAANSSTRVHLFLYRGTNSGTLINNSGANFYTQSSVDQRGTVALSVLDSPSTTSAQIYTLYFSNDENVATVSVNRDSNSGTSTMTLMEIAA